MSEPLHQCLRCGGFFEWTAKHFYKRYKSDEVARQKGREKNLQPHCKECSRKKR